MSRQSSAIHPDAEADAEVSKTVRCSYCGHEISDHETTSPCPHCNEFAFPVEAEK